MAKYDDLLARAGDIDIGDVIKEMADAITSLQEEVESLTEDVSDLEDEVEKKEEAINALTGEVEDATEAHRLLGLAREHGTAPGIEKSLEVALDYACANFPRSGGEVKALEYLIAHV